MIKAAIIICFCIAYWATIAQTDKSASPIPISKEAALKFKTINEVLELPDIYRVLHYTVWFSDPERGLSTPGKEWSIPSIFSNTGVGTQIIFTDILLKKGERQIKLADKEYIIK